MIRQQELLQRVPREGGGRGGIWASSPTSSCPYSSYAPSALSSLAPASMSSSSWCSRYRTYCSGNGLLSSTQRIQQHEKEQRLRHLRIEIRLSAQKQQQHQQLDEKKKQVVVRYGETGGAILAAEDVRIR